ncbi:DEAD/DEAH box helicase [Geomonas terrae]|nr:DEAD/DEAH box helicase [Geomonas terrae]
MHSYAEVYQSEELDSCICSLLYNLLCKRYKLTFQEVELKRVRKSGWLASILADSSEESHRHKSQAFAILLHLTGNNNPEYDKLSYVILSRLGNLAITRLIPSLYLPDLDNQIRLEFGDILNLEIAYERSKRTISSGNSQILTTDFQLSLWQNLKSDKNISISAPTSSGKSFILQSYIKEVISHTQKFHCLYIVPTKAMLSEVSNDLRNALEGVSVKTAYLIGEVIENDLGERLNESDDDKIIYILTPERCLKYLEHSASSSFRPTIIFADEIQNVEDEKGRGILFEYVYEQLARQFAEAKFISAGPFIGEARTLFNNIFGLDCTVSKTLLAPVLQVKTTVKSTADKNELIVYAKESKTNTRAVVAMPVDYNLNYELKRNKGTGIARVIHSLGNIGQSIVYCSRPDYAESWCLRYAQSDTQSADYDEVSDNVKELIEYLVEEIHPKYHLIECLKNKAAFHHSKLPDVVRSEIETCFKLGLINTIYCTSTLLQGVNLPANNLFVSSPYKKNIALSKFDFGNLIGRAGRIRDSLYGTIYCIEDNENPWADSYYDVPYERPIKSATFKCLTHIEPIMKNIYLDANGIKESNIRNIVVYLRHKYMEESSNGFEQFLTKRSVPEGERANIISALNDTMCGMWLPAQILRLNPTVDPLLQNKLYKEILSDGIEKWVVNINSNFYKIIGKTELHNYKYEEYSFYWQFNSICTKLDLIFDISKESFFKHDISLTIESIAYYSYRWLQNRTLKEIIDSTLDFECYKKRCINIDNDDEINKSINKVISIHSKIVTYLLVKYFKLLCDILKFAMNHEQLEKYKFTLSLPVMLELGTTDPLAIRLMSAGVPRSVALAVVKSYKACRREEDILDWIKQPQCADNLKPIYLRYLKHNRYM